jgi:hypothetical protein
MADHATRVGGGDPFLDRCDLPAIKNGLLIRLTVCAIEPVLRAIGTLNAAVRFTSFQLRT